MTASRITANDYLQRVGATFRGLINDLKRNDQAAADELGVELPVIREIIAGERPLPMDLIERAVRIWPVNERDFFPMRDDAPTGIIVMRTADSAASSRVFPRGGKDYYEYRDTAMSRVAMMRPEWIRILHQVDDCDPANPTVQWNNGHFFYQFTYFVGAVNYYYEFDGRRGCVAMVTGDSVFGLPFARHSFATRRPAEPGLILALTFGGRLFGDPQHELAVVGRDKARKFVLEGNERRQAHAALLAMHANNGSYSAAYLAEAAGLDRRRVDRLLTGDEAMDPETLVRLAEAMHIPPRELMPVAADTTDGIVIRRRDQGRSWLLPDEDRPSYRMRELAGSRVTPFSKSLELEVLGTASGAILETALHEYGYCLGSSPVALEWTDAGARYGTTLGHGDSFYVKPFVPHWFRAQQDPGAAADARVLLLRVGGRIVGDTQLEASLLGTNAIQRVGAEKHCWYNAGKP